MVGWPNRPFTAGNGGRGRGSPLWPSIEVSSAVSSPQTNAPAPRRSSMSKLKPVRKYVLTQQAVFARLLDGDLKALDGNRVFRTDIYVALVCADGVTGDGHRLQHGVRVALEHRAVHKRAGVALVRVAYDVFLIRNALGGKVPLRAGGEARAAAAAQTAVGDELDDLRRRHLGQTFAERLIAVHRDVFVDDSRG